MNEYGHKILADSIIKKVTELDKETAQQILSMAMQSTTLDSNFEAIPPTTSYILPSNIENPFPNINATNQETFNIAGSESGRVNMDSYIENNSSKEVNLQDYGINVYDKSNNLLFPLVKVWHNLFFGSFLFGNSRLLRNLRCSFFHENRTF